MNDSALAEALETEFGSGKGKLARIGKVTVRLWHEPADHPEKTDFPLFLPPRAASDLQRHLIAAVEATGKGAGAKLPFRFAGCDSTGMLRAVGKPDLDPGPEAVNACGFLVKSPKAGRLRQFEFMVAGDRQFIYVTTDVFQRPAVFESTYTLSDRVVVFARPDSWGSELEVLGVSSNPYRSDAPSDKTQSFELKRALRLDKEPSSLSDASFRWYERQVNIEARKPVLGATVLGVTAVVGFAEMLAGIGAMHAAGSGALAISSPASMSAAAATSTANTLAMIGGAWKTAAGFFLAASSTAELVQTQRIIDLEGNPEKRANMEFAYTVFTRTSQFVGFTDLVVARPAVFRAMTRAYLKGRVFSTLAAQKAQLDMQAGRLAVGTLRDQAKSVSDETIGLFREIASVSTSKGGFGAKVRAVLDQAAAHGRLTRAAGGKVADAHKRAAEISLRGPKWYSDTLNDIIEQAYKSLDARLVAGAGARMSAEAVETARSVVDEEAMRAVIKFYTQVFSSSGADSAH